MASPPSHAAIHQIIFLVENDDAPDRMGTIWRPPLFASLTKATPQKLSREWKAIYELYEDVRPAPPLDYLDSLELTLVLKGEVDDDDVRAIFAHGKPLRFWGCPRLLVSKIVEAFREQQEEPTFLDMTISALSGFGATRPAEAWAQVYTTHLPCHACSTVETVAERSIPRLTDLEREGTVDVAVERFHVSSKNFGKQLTVELHYRLEEEEQSLSVHTIAIRLASEPCSAQRRLSGIPTRSSATLLLLPDFSLEILGFLDRAHVGPSLLANRDLHDLICQLKQRLPVHHLKCSFEDIFIGGGCAARPTGAYWLTLCHFQRDLSYTAVRRFKVPSTAGAESDCALIRHYLGNSYTADLRAPRYDGFFPFAIKMLASLAPRNFSVGSVELIARSERLSDYRSMDVIFGGLQTRSLSLSCDENRFVELVMTTDFFRLSTTEPRYYGWHARGKSWSKSPLWVAGIYLLRNCEHYRVVYWSDAHRQTIERKMVRICEKFERGKITDTVGHFQFSTKLSRGLLSKLSMTYSFNRDNLLVSGLKIEGKTRWDEPNNFEWDVYRFRNACTGEYLTACVGHQYGKAFVPKSILHISKGEVYPDASFALY